MSATATFQRLSREQGYAEGYQAAMVDMYDAFQRGGLPAMLEWVSNNATGDRELAVAARAAFNAVAD